MDLTRESFVNMTEAVALKDDTTYSDTFKLAQACKENSFLLCYGLNCFTPDLIQLLKGHKTMVGAPVGGSSVGCELEETKLYDTERFIDMGCEEIDIIMNIPYLRSEKYELIKHELRKIREITGKRTLKVIIQSGMLTESEIKIASELVLDSGADFIKTNTGFVGKTTIEQVRIIKNVVGNRLQIKAAGGVEGIPMIRQLIDMGVTRIGLSYLKAVEIAKELS